MDIGDLYRKHASDVHRFALYLTGDPALAEDITSETFIRAWTARERIRQPTVKAYLFTIARHLFLEGVRRNRGREQDPSALEGRLVDPRRSPARELEERDDLEVVMRDLQALPEVDRAALLLRAEEELSYEEVGAALGITAAAARVKVHRARLRLASARATRETMS